MGIYSSKNKDKKSERIILEKINMQIIIENINKRELNSASDFSMEKLKIKAVKLYEEAMTINNEEDKYLKLKDAVSYDNTNNKILKEYLKIESYEIKKMVMIILIIIIIIFLQNAMKKLWVKKKENPLWNCLKKYLNFLKIIAQKIKMI